MGLQTNCCKKRVPNKARIKGFGGYIFCKHCGNITQSLKIVGSDKNESKTN